MKLWIKSKLKQNIGMSVNIRKSLHQLCNEISKQFTTWALQKAWFESTIILKFLKVTCTVLAIGIYMNKGWYRRTSLQICPDSDKIKQNKMKYYGKHKQVKIYINNIKWNKINKWNNINKIK